MKQIRITAPGSVSDGAGLRAHHGQVVSVNDDLARAWIAAGHAEAAPEEHRTGAKPDKRTATRTAPRKAAAKTLAPPDAPAGGDTDAGKQT
ncbi:hypothetical protein [uncultured Streptomyces sp.]|uniref:DUF7302 family protein n=1 Tax=uncultured Streptomyces sp. TaxID=174707 RepID=UPI0026276E4E|nr:hypothetical protein [uncultured Streptomyces sp.]